MSAVFVDPGGLVAASDVTVRVGRTGVSASLPGTGITCILRRIYMAAGRVTVIEQYRLRMTLLTWPLLYGVRREASSAAE